MIHAADAVHFEERSWPTGMLLTGALRVEINARLNWEVMDDPAWRAEAQRRVALAIWHSLYGDVYAQLKRIEHILRAQAASKMDEDGMRALQLAQDLLQSLSEGREKSHGG